MKSLAMWGWELCLHNHMHLPYHQRRFLLPWTWHYRRMDIGDNIRTLNTRIRGRSIEELTDGIGTVSSISKEYVLASRRSNYMCWIRTGLLI